MRRVNLSTLKITSEQVAAALAGETRPFMRKRLTALQSILMGNSVARAAADADAWYGTVERWVHMLRNDGFAAILDDDRSRPRRGGVNLTGIKVSRSDVRAALAQATDDLIRTRLRAVDLLLQGRKAKDVAVAVGTARVSITNWLRTLRRHGLAGLTRRTEARRRGRPLHLDVNSRALRAAAAHEGDRRTAIRMLAVADVTDGTSTAVAAARAGTVPDSVNNWVRKYLVDGVQGLRDKPMGRPRKRDLSQGGRRGRPLHLAVKSHALRRAAAREGDARTAIRLLAVADVADGMSTAAAAARAGSTPANVNNWVRKYLSGGVQGLRDKPIRHPRKRDLWRKRLLARAAKPMARYRRAMAAVVSANPSHRDPVTLN